MEFKDLEKLITQLSENGEKSQEEIIADLGEYANVKFGRNVAESERAIINTLKDKIITNLYRLIRHEIIMRNPEIAKYLSLDALDMKYLNQAIEELHQEGLVTTDYFIKLTDSGILKAKQLRGEL